MLTFTRLLNLSKLFQTLDLFLEPPPAKAMVDAGGLMESILVPFLESAKSLSSIRSNE
jgi:hypothetical protein